MSEVVTTSPWIPSASSQLAATSLAFLIPDSSVSYLNSFDIPDDRSTFTISRHLNDKGR